MKFQELNLEELKEVNGGLLGGNGSSESASGGTLIGGLGINLMSESTNSNGSSDSFGLGINLSDVGSFLSQNRRN